MSAHPPDRLDVDRLRTALFGSLIGREIVVLEEVASTNDDLWQRAEKGSSAGLVVFAERQTAGRGQRGNIWESPVYRGLYFSVLLRPEIELQNSTRLTTWAAESIAACIRREFSFGAMVKPPNDVHIEGEKVAGVLVEMRAQPQRRHVAIVGVGVNVNQTRQDFSVDLRKRATSLSILAGHLLDRNEFAIALLQSLDRTYPKIFGRRKF